MANHRCNLCPYLSASRGYLTVHMRTHTGQKPYNSALQRHIRIHTGEKPYKCTLCSYACTTQSNLTTHMRIHTGEKPYKCTLCSYACTTQGSLTTHMRTHTGEKPYKCTMFLCLQHPEQSDGPMLFTPGYLTTHMRTHTGEKPYKCSQCSFACAQSSNLKQHMRSRHSLDKKLKSTLLYDTQASFYAKQPLLLAIISHSLRLWAWPEDNLVSITQPDPSGAWEVTGAQNPGISGFRAPVSQVAYRCGQRLIASFAQLFMGFQMSHHSAGSEWGAKSYRCSKSGNFGISRTCISARQGLSNEPSLSRIRVGRGKLPFYVTHVTHVSRGVPESLGPGSMEKGELLFVGLMGQTSVFTCALG
ncbi:zinc-finger double domain-containing protein [Ditylenchus destructor]|nr:zinc-finger double domain-containing protein [Ditylenchus destructor]